MFDWFESNPGRLYVVATLLPLASFALLLLAGGVRALCRPSRQAPGIPSTLYWLFGGDRPLKSGAYFATGCMAAAAAIAITGLVLFLQDSEKHLKPEAMAARWSERMDWVRIGSQNSAAPADWEKRTEADPDRTPPRTALALELGYKIDHLAALMFAVATLALRRRDVRHASVKAGVLRDIGGDRFVTIKAQRGLAMAIGAVVAQRTGLLLFDMRLADLSGHQQGLNARGTRAERSSQCGKRQHCHSGCLESSHHQ